MFSKIIFGFAILAVAVLAGCQPGPIEPTDGMIQHHVSFEGI